VELNARNTDRVTLTYRGLKKIKQSPLLASGFSKLGKDPLETMLKKAHGLNWRAQSSSIKLQTELEALAGNANTDFVKKI